MENTNELLENINFDFKDVTSGEFDQDSSERKQDQNIYFNASQKELELAEKGVLSLMSDKLLCTDDIFDKCILFYTVMRYLLANAGDEIGRQERTVARAPEKLYINYNEIFDFTSRIIDGNIYSSRYIDKAVWLDSFEHHVLIHMFSINRMTAGASVGEVLDKKRNWSISDEYSDVLKKKIPVSKNGCMDLFSLVNDAVFLSGTPLANLESLISDNISDMSVAQLFDLLQIYGAHADKNYDYLQKNFFEGSSRSLDSKLKESFSDLSDSYYDYICTRVRQELTSRCVEAKSSISTFANAVYKGLFFVPTWLYQYLSKNNYNIDEYSAKIIWAWSYIVTHQPDGYDINFKGLQQNQACIYLVDVLPSLYGFFNDKYSSFDKKYNKSNRVRIYEDKTDEYEKFRKEITLPEDFMQYLVE